MLITKTGMGDKMACETRSHSLLVCLCDHVLSTVRRLQPWRLP